jgi:hypothetical protein
MSIGYLFQWLKVTSALPFSGLSFGAAFFAKTVYHCLLPLGLVVERLLIALKGAQLWKVQE